MYKPTELNPHNPVVYGHVLACDTDCEWCYMPGNHYGGDEPEDLRVSWRSIGSVSPAEAREYALAILRAADEVEAWAHKAREQKAAPE